MSALKRRRGSEAGSVASQGSSHGRGYANSDEELDIGDALIRPAKRARFASNGKAASRAGKGDDDDDDSVFIADLMTKHNVKAGTEVVKKSKGKKGNVAKGAVGGGSFQSMGIHPSLLRALLLRGYQHPTPIQRLAIPALLASPPQDLVGMARTGSGKTLAYMIPLIQRLGGRHQTTFGARALVLIPTRELALQVLKVGKDLARGWAGIAHDAPEGGDKSSMALRWGLVVGGEGLDEQFEMITNNPDVIIATPGRLLHLAVEMNLDLKSVDFVVFDEADRLFEQGFATALHEILHRLPSTRQTLLFSATLPKTLVEFTTAGLRDPKFVRLDAESKLSSDLRMAFLRVRQTEKDATLLALLKDVIQVPLGSPQAQTEGPSKGKDDKHDVTIAAPHQTLIFAATKHHVEYLTTLLTAIGYSVSHIYGSLDQTARSLQMARFRNGLSSLLVVTDVAARGIDIPILENVVNYDFPAGARVFIHRVGRTARAGRKGWAWSIITNTDLPYLLDLQLFLGREIKSTAADENAYTASLIVGSVPRDVLDDNVEFIKLLEHDKHRTLPTLREVMRKGHAMYERTKGKASHSSYERAKVFAKAEADGAVHPVFLRDSRAGERQANTSRASLLAVVNSFTPGETVFEIGSRGKTPGSILMKERRRALSRAQQRAVPAPVASASASGGTRMVEEDIGSAGDEEEVTEARDSVVIEATGSAQFKDPEFYMSHYQKDAATDKGYSMRDGASFMEQARTATFDLTTDEGVAQRQRHGSQLTWDRKKKKFIKGTGEGADNVKILKTESGARLPATYRSGRFEEWKAKSRVSLPRVGEVEPETARRGMSSFGAGKRFKHQTSTAPKPLDPKHVNYERKLRQNKKKATGSESAAPEPSRPGKPGSRFKASGRGLMKGGNVGRVKSELKNADQIRKSREAQARKKAKNARPSHKGKNKR